MTKTELNECIAAAKRMVASGRATIAPPSVLAYDTIKRNCKRERFKAEGLTREGKPRKTAKHPELQGLSREEYFKAYRRIYRGKDLDVAA